MGDDVSVGAYVHISAIWFELRTFENHRDGRICRQEVGVFTVDRFGRPSLIFEDLSTFAVRALSWVHVSQAGEQMRKGG